jgi:hypothetical protein
VGFLLLEAKQHIELVELNEAANDCVRNNKTDNPAGEGERPLHRLTVPLQQSSHDHDAAFPSIVLIEWKEVAGGEKKIHPTKDSPVGNQAENEI